MTSTEKDRLDLRQEFERLFNNKRIAEIAMEDMPPIDYSQLATRQDLAAIDNKMQAQFARIEGRFAQIDGRFAQIDGRFAQVEGAIAETRGELKSDIASNLHKMIAAQITTMMMIGAWMAAIT